MLSASLILLCFLGAWMLGSGFAKRIDVYLTAYNISADGSSVTLETGLAGSMGYIRGCKAVPVDGELHVTFYAAFGGLNSRLGANNCFEVTLPSDCNAVCFHRGGKDFAPVLRKNAATNEWESAR